MPKRGMSMFARLFLLIGLMSSVSLGLVTGLLWRNSVELERQLRAENDAAEKRVLPSGTSLLEANLRATNGMIVSEKARKVERYSKPTLMRRLGAFFALTQRDVPGCDSTYFGSELGFILGYPGGKTYFKNACDPRKRLWYSQAAAPEKRPNRFYLCFGKYAARNARRAAQRVFRRGDESDSKLGRHAR